MKWKKSIALKAYKNTWFGRFSWQSSILENTKINVEENTVMSKTGTLLYCDTYIQYVQENRIKTDKYVVNK